MKILVGALLFDDTARIGSHRARSLARELAARGHDVTVVAPETSHPSESPPGVKVRRIGNYSPGPESLSRRARLARKGLIALVIAPTVLPVAWLKRVTERRPDQAFSERLAELTQRRYSSIQRLDEILATRVWSREVASGLSVDGEEPKFDVLFSTNDQLGVVLQESDVATRWVNDFRDPLDSSSFLPAVRQYLRRHQRKLLEKADWTTAVSSGVKDSLLRSTRNRRAAASTSVLTNGFSARPTAPPPTGIGPLRIAYTGALYRERVPLFRELISLLQALVDDGVEVELHYAGRNHPLVEQITDEQGAGGVVVSHGMLSHEDSLRLQADSDILLVTSWNSPEETGVLSGKLLEYLGAQRPILGMVAGPLAGSEIRQVLEKTNTGYCYEEASGPESKKGLEAWLRDAATKRSQGLPFTFAPNATEVTLFSYPAIAAQLEDILLRVADAQS